MARAPSAGAILSKEIHHSSTTQQCARYSKETGLKAAESFLLPFQCLVPRFQPRRASTYQPTSEWRIFELMPNEPEQVGEEGPPNPREIPEGKRVLGLNRLTSTTYSRESLEDAAPQATLIRALSTPSGAHFPLLQVGYNAPQSSDNGTKREGCSLRAVPPDL